MNKIRLNDEEEREIVAARFRIPPIIVVLFVFIFLNALISLIVGIVLDVHASSDVDLYSYEEASSSSSVAGPLIALGIAFIVVLVPILIAWMVGIKKSKCVVTNKRIYGVTSIFIARKQYSYRLDEIESVETVSTLGINGLALNFSQGYGPQGNVRYNRGVATVSGAGVFKINFIADVDEVYSKLSQLLTSVKNDKDLMVDIEMSKIEAENRKAAAFENIATNINGNSTTKQQNVSSNYIEELKQLKSLLDAGILSEEEFNEKKKQILKNH